MQGSDNSKNRDSIMDSGLDEIENSSATEGGNLPESADDVMDITDLGLPDDAFDDDSVVGMEDSLSDLEEIGEKDTTSNSDDSLLSSENGDALDELFGEEKTSSFDAPLTENDSSILDNEDKEQGALAEESSDDFDSIMGESIDEALKSSEPNASNSVAADEADELDEFLKSSEPNNADANDDIDELIKSSDAESSGEKSELDANDDLDEFFKSSDAESSGEKSELDAVDDLDDFFKSSDAESSSEESGLDAVDNIDDIDELFKGADAESSSEESGLDAVDNIDDIDELFKGADAESSGEESGLDAVDNIDDIDELFKGSEQGDSAADDELDDIFKTPELDKEASEEEDEDPLNEWSKDLSNDDEEDELVDDWTKGFGNSEHEEELDEKNGVGDDSTPEELSDLLDSLVDNESKENNALEDDNPSIDVTEEKEPLVEKKQKTEKSAVKEENKTSKMKSIKKKLSLKVVIPALLLSGVGLGAAGYTQGYFDNFIPSFDFSSNDKAVAPPPKLATEKELTKLRNELNSLKEQISNLNAYKEKSLQEQSEIQNSVNLAMDSVNENKRNLVSLGNGIDNYEVEMIKRIQKVLTLTQAVSNKQDSAEQNIKDSVLRDALKIMKSQNSDVDGKKLMAIQSDISALKSKVPQIEAAVLSQKQMFSLVEDEVTYVKKRLKDRAVAPSVEVKGKAKPEPQKKAEIVVESSPQASAKPIRQVDPSRAAYDADFIELSVAGAHVKPNGEYDIYLQPKNTTRANAIIPYWYSPSQSSVVPGYGRILGVKKLKNSKLRVPYVVVTEKGEIRGKP